MVNCTRCLLILFCMLIFSFSYSANDDLSDTSVSFHTPSPSSSSATESPDLYSSCSSHFLFKSDSLCKITFPDSPHTPSPRQFSRVFKKRMSQSDDVNRKKTTGHKTGYAIRRNNSSPETRRFFDNLRLWDNVHKCLDKKEKKTALMFAAQNGFPLEVRKILVYDVTGINKQDFEKKTALILAVENMHIQVIKALLDFDPDIYRRDHRGFDARLHIVHKMLSFANEKKDITGCKKILQLIEVHEKTIIVKNTDG